MLECPCCGAEDLTCDECRGTGCDPDKIKIRAWKEAEDRFIYDRKNKNISAIYEGHSRVGWKADGGKNLRYDQFLIEQEVD